MLTQFTTTGEVEHVCLNPMSQDLYLQGLACEGKFKVELGH